MHRRELDLVHHEDGGWRLFRYEFPFSFSHLFLHPFWVLKDAFSTRFAFFPMGFSGFLLQGAETVYCMEDRSLHGLPALMDLPLVGSGADGTHCMVDW